MATIHDVARMAGVSTGTVSNYLNNKYVGADRSRAICQAIEKLHYEPNRIARSLKGGPSSSVILILPNLLEEIFSEIATTLITQLAERDCQIQIELTNDSPERERRLLRKCFSNYYAGVFLCSCIPDETETLAKLSQLKPVVFLLRRPNALEDYSFFGFDNYDIIYRITARLLNDGERNLSLWTGLQAFSCERSCAKAFSQAHADAGMSPPDAEIHSLPSTRELIFRQASDMFAQPKHPKVVIASSKFIADALIEAAYYQNIILNKNVCIISLGDGKWGNADQLYCNLSTNRSVKGLAMEASQFMLECLDYPNSHEANIRQIRDDFPAARLTSVLATLHRPSAPKPVRAHRQCLRIISPDCDTGVQSISGMTPWIAESIDIDIDMKLMPVYDILPLLISEHQNGGASFDIFHLDNSWMAQAVDMGMIRDISDYFQSRPLISNALAANLVDALATIHGRIYGAPSLLCSQMLFYRKDLFEDPEMQRAFSQRYKRPLRPPETWFEYRLIAEFFTRRFNPDSPCEYGLIMGTMDMEMMLTEIFPRIWSYGGSLFDDHGNVSIYSEEVMQAIRNYIACLDYCEPDHGEILLPQYPVRFAEGVAAMMIGYDIHACNLTNYEKTKIAERIGFAPVPGGIPTLGGWNFCISAKCDKIEEAYKFFDWIYSPDIAIPYTLLGGGSPRKNVVSSPEVISMYPWMQFTTENFMQSRKRFVPENDRFINPSEVEVEKILADVVYRSIKSPENLQKYLREAEHKLLFMRKPKA